MTQVQEKYIKKQSLMEWRFELRVRYLPNSLRDLYEKDRITFFYFFDQVSSTIVFFQFQLTPADIRNEIQSSYNLYSPRSE